ncbi:hypothetical protein Pmani_033217 [Petrolisthes manimaculis]|uniref:Uncharacterized protein n=1 Tax=Petrolisthes manimaculis TaxID=1843537 RepID=A0AAE1TQN8_9EUCA|nr:hypothetical protein Pmani_033217 [Petrolisthes manimaculis]
MHTTATNRRHFGRYSASSEEHFKDLNVVLAQLAISRENAIISCKIWLGLKCSVRWDECGMADIRQGEVPSGPGSKASNSLVVNSSQLYLHTHQDGGSAE